MFIYTNEYDYYMEYENDFLNSEPFGLLVFVRNHCNDCQVLLNSIESWADDNDVPVYAFECKDNETIVRDMNIIGVPTVLLYVNGELHTRFEEDLSPQAIIQEILSIIGQTEADI